MSAAIQLLSGALQNLSSGRWDSESGFLSVVQAPYTLLGELWLHLKQYRIQLHCLKGPSSFNWLSVQNCSIPMQFSEQACPWRLVCLLKTIPQGLCHIIREQPAPWSCRKLCDGLHYLEIKSRGRRNLRSPSFSS